LRFLGRLAAALAIGLAAAAAVTSAKSESAPVPSIHRGISIHDVLNWPEMTKAPATSYVWPPFATDRYALHAEELARLKRTGFDTIRLTVGLGIFLSADERQSEELDRILLDRVSQLIAAGFTVVVDFHPITQDPRFPPVAFTRGPGQPLVEAFRALLVRTAGNLSRLPPGKVVLEILNEPATRDWSQQEVDLWRRTQKSYFESIRAGSPNLPVMVTGCCDCCGLELTKIDPTDYPGPNVYFTFHFYSPHAFTHQGVVDRSRPFGPTQLLRNVPFPLTPESLAEVESRGRGALKALTIQDPQSQRQAERDLDLALRRLRQFATPNDIDVVFDKNIAWSKGHDIPPQRIVLGEFGVMRPHVDPDSRRRWIETVRLAAERRKILWIYWSLDGPEYMGLRLDRKKQAFDPVILDALGLSHEGLRP